MAAFRPNVSVECLSRLTKMDRVHAWRAVERFAALGATEHGPCKLLIYNQHQPASDERPFPANMRIAFCKAVIGDAIGFCHDDVACCGFAFGGDANCSLATWTVAFQEVSVWNMTFQAPQFLEVVRHKGGDFVFSAAVKGADLTIYENRCEVEGRERQHDCMFFVWSFRGRSYAAPPSLPARNVRPRV